MNPWVRSARARGYLAAGDAWARVAVECARLARICWDKGRAEAWRADVEFRRLGRQLARRNRTDAEWKGVEARIAAALDARDESVEG